MTFENLSSQIEFSKTSSNVVMNSILSRSRLLRISICHRADSPAHKLQEPRENHRVASVVQCVAVFAVCCSVLQCVAGCCRVLQGVALSSEWVLQSVALSSHGVSLSQNYRSLLQNIVPFTGLFCKRRQYRVLPCPCMESLVSRMEMSYRNRNSSRICTWFATCPFYSHG